MENMLEVLENYNGVMLLSSYQTSDYASMAKALVSNGETEITIIVARGGSPEYMYQYGAWKDYSNVTLEQRELLDLIASIYEDQLIENGAYIVITPEAI